MSLEEKDNDKINNDDTSKGIDYFSSSILEQIQNFKKRLDGNNKQVRFSPKIRRIALSLWSKSNSVYRELLESNLLILPSKSTLKKKHQKLNVHEGYCPNIYSTFYDVFVKKTNSPIGLNNEKVIGYF